MKKILFLFLIFAIASCSTDDGNDGNSNDNFDRSAMMANLADNIIIPSYEELQQALETLTDRKDSFIASRDQSSLDDLRSAYIDAYKKWQRVEMFNIAKADEIQYAFQMNVFPTDVNNVEDNVINGGYDLTSVNNHDALGFPALDYLLYGVSAGDQSIINVYNNDNYKDYLSDLIERMKELTTIVLDDWNAGYRDEFVAGTANNATSPINLIVNDYVEYYERKLRANKIGIPAGVFSNETLPEKVEGLHSRQFSKELAMEALTAFQDFFNGVSNVNPNGSPASLAGYSDALEDTDSYTDIATLSSLINAQIDVARDQMATLDNDFKNQVETNNMEMLQTYDELQRVVVLMKVDMLSLLNISIDYIDADGD
ncbi:MAG: imelysin family protein [Nonlabens sp.]